MRDRNYWNAARYDGTQRGHYESYFQRANHPSEPRAFWIRYTVFSPNGRPADALGELWAISFDRTNDQIVAVRETKPIADCSFSNRRLQARIGKATLDAGSLQGSASFEGHRIGWDLRYSSPDDPLLLFDESLYVRRFPKAKALVGSPHAVYAGAIDVDGSRVAIDGWVGSQNHNWGSKHTDAYAWGQVAGFDDAPHVFLECATAQVKLGPFWTPRFTVVAMRVGNDTISLNTLGQALRARGSYELFKWQFDSKRDDVRIHGSIEAPRAAFVGLTYLNPPGGSKTCLNSKVAHCEVTLERAGQAQTFTTRSRAAFEILTDEPAHGIPVLAS
jgi:hypothetical protein